MYVCARGVSGLCVCVVCVCCVCMCVGGVYERVGGVLCACVHVVYVCVCCVCVWCVWCVCGVCACMQYACLCV